MNLLLHQSDEVATSQLAAALLDGADYMPTVMEPLGPLGITEGLGVAARLPLVLRCQLVVLRAAAALRATPASHRVPPPAWSEAAFFSLLAVSFFLRATLCFSAHASHLVWFGMACSRQSLHRPDALSLSRRSFSYSP